MAGRGRAVAAAFALATLSLVVPVQGVRDRLGALADAPPSSGAADYDEAAIALVEAGAWWRVEPDYSYFLAMHDRFARGPRGAPSLVATYGPWGFLHRGATPATYLSALAAWAFLGLCFAAVGELSGRDRGAPAGPEALRRAALLAALAIQPRELVLLLLPAGAGEGRDDDDGIAGWALRVAACAGAALAALVKHNALVLSVVAIGVLVARRVAAGRSPGPEPLVFTASFLAFWVGAGERLADLPRHFAGAFAVVAAYGESASIPAEPGSWGVPIAVALLGLVLGLETLAAIRRADRDGVLQALGASAAALIVFRSGALRAANHEHLVLTWAGLAALALLRLPAWSRALARGPGAGRVLAYGAAAAGLGLAPLVPPAEVGRQLAAWSRPAEARRASDVRAAADLAAIRARNPLPPLAGTVDLFQNRLSILIAHGLAWSPRPVFQSYLATGGALSRWNAEHLAGPSAPESVLFEAWSIDGRLPALDDALAGLELLRRYDVVAVSERLALLRRRSAPRRVSLAPAGEAVATLGEEVRVPLPAGRLVWVTVSVEPTLLGRLASLVYKLPELGVRLRLADGRETRWRYVRSAGEAGFLLSPSVEGALDMALLVSGPREPLASKGVTAIAIRPSRAGSSRAWRDRVELRFREVVVGPDVRDGEGEAPRPPPREPGRTETGEAPTSSSP